MYVPKEIHEYILQFIEDEDKIYASMTCTLWSKILEDMFHKKYNKDIVPTKCAYDLYLYLKHFKSSLKIVTESDRCLVPGIYIVIASTKNCLNVLANHVSQGITNKSNFNWWYGTSNGISVSSILSGCKIIDHCPLKYMEYLVNNGCFNLGMLFEDVLWKRSWSIADYLLTQKANIDCWIQNINILDFNMYYDDTVIIIKYLKKKEVDLSNLLKIIEQNDFDCKHQFIDLIKN